VLGMWFGIRIFALCGHMIHKPIGHLSLFLRSQVVGVEDEDVTKSLNNLKHKARKVV